MNTETQTAPTTPHFTATVLAKLQAAKSIGMSLAITLPALGLSALLLEQGRLAWPHSHLLVTVILSLMVMDFIMLMVLEPHRDMLGKVTIPAILGFIGIAMAFVITEAMNRFAIGYGFAWTMPFVGAALLALYGGVFFERHLALKLFLCLNGIALTVLWCLGDAGKMTLPF
jgi:hypothetical protein